MTILLESQESSSPVITRAVAKGLLGESLDNYYFSYFEQLALRILGNLPKEFAEWIIPRVNSTKALSKNDVMNVKTSDLVNNRLLDYKNITSKYPAVTVGVGMGGATAHLALALGGPFLPQAFVVTLRKGTMNGNVKDYFLLAKDIAKVITDTNQDLMTIQHYDPVHDGWLVKRVNHLRLKLIDLPKEYKHFLKEKLMPGGEVVYLEGKARWKRFRTGERNVFQVGGWGDISADEFINGSQRLREFAKREKLDFSSWKLSDFPIEDGPESEWGSEIGLGESLQKFCNEEGYEFVKISFEDPNNFSKLAFCAKKEILKKANIESAGVVVEMFSQFDTTIVDQSSLLPLWLIFNTSDSRDFLKKMTDDFPLGKPVFFSGLSTFSRTPDLVSWSDWTKVLEDCDVINIGSRESHYPADALALLNWKKPLEKWAESNPINFNTKITGKELAEFARKIDPDN